MSQQIQRTTGHSPELLAACRRGDRRALETVLRAESPYLERLLTRMVGPGADLEDLLQQTLIAVVKAFPRFRGEASARTWMARIAVNIARQYMRKPHRRKTVALELVPERPSDADSLDKTADHREQLERLFEHLAKIGEKKRIAFVLHVFEGYPIEEVAALTGATKAATKSRIFWARKALLSKARKDPVLRELVEHLEESS